MTRGSKAKYSEKQKRQARDIEQGYEKRGVSQKESQKRAWATVNKMWGGGQKGTGVNKPINVEPARKGGKLGGMAASKRSAKARKLSAKKAVMTRKRKQNKHKPYQRGVTST